METQVNITGINNIVTMDTSIIGAGMADLATRMFEFQLSNGQIFSAVYCRDIHKVLKAHATYQDWMKRKGMQVFHDTGEILTIDNYDLVQLLSDPQVKVVASDILSKPNAVHHFTTVDVTKHIALMERTEQGRLVRQYFINLEHVSTEEQKRVAVEAAVKQTEAKLNTEWSAYFLSDPTNLFDPDYDAKNALVYQYASGVYTHASVHEVNSRFDKDADNVALAQYCADYGLEVPERNGVPIYPAQAFANVHGIDIVALYVEYYGANLCEQNIDVDDLI
jgi:phage anti-repressor protein